MIGRMRPFYQAHWDISNDIKHVQLLFCAYITLHGFSVSSRWEGEGARERWWDREYRVWTALCIASRMSRAFCPLEGGGGGADILAPGLHWEGDLSTCLWPEGQHRSRSGSAGPGCCSVTWASHWRQTKYPCFANKSNPIHFLNIFYI